MDKGKGIPTNFEELNINSSRCQGTQIDLSGDDVQRLLDLFQDLQVGSPS